MSTNPIPEQAIKESLTEASLLLMLEDRNGAFFYLKTAIELGATAEQVQTVLTKFTIEEIQDTIDKFHATQKRKDTR